MVLSTGINLQKVETMREIQERLTLSFSVCLSPAGIVEPSQVVECVLSSTGLGRATSNSTKSY